ncbi:MULTISPECIES: oligogalacturonate-specific porin KdgM family protein [unclassified Agarivorans]|uniref:oligogalacturonate-specific porin KdgM family protein n=1 Tax=unclassified Agarivorans TaxID=2636026 RepID=UPI0026E464D8|nr:MULTISPECIES: oligogalacturonate-specific porin KdgM family protein [unclassified Agarivorans]MDO6684852.1 oligogalacturonate-specific porin KdgM family protein [Agarivorans sp. 3_MG-2023]MDO6714987.1 oligogalacturonate-specific porin KdgM family protein [Agarivorans sp. 2_MG-2023]MDO6764093.1 oligogalacturonate-specific porin KdgM family protein [Agarivorans sp. 1_MG-2023]
MNKMKALPIAIAAVFLSGTAFAGQLDIRTEYKHESEDHAGRIKIGDSTKVSDQGKVYYSVEMKFFSGDKVDGTPGGFLENLQRGDSEFDFGYRHKLNKKWYIQPGMPITFGSERITYKPQFRVGYTSDFGLKTALRYRYEIRQYADGKENGETWNKSKITLTGGYKVKSMPNLKLDYEANYWKSHEYEWDAEAGKAKDAQFNNGDDNWDAGIFIGYQIEKWRPYVEFWNSSVSSKTDQRQLKTRIGVKYKF